EPNVPPPPVDADAPPPPAPPPLDPNAPPPAPPPPPVDGDAPPPPVDVDAPPPPAPPPPPVDGDAPPPPAPPPVDGDAPPPAPPPPADGDAPPPPAPPPPPPVAGDAPPPPAPGHPHAPPPPLAGHTFHDLLGGDHADIQLLDGTGEVALDFELDYLSEDPSAPSGFASLGVSGGEGKVVVGRPEWILAATSSLDRNLNACGLASFTEDSPATDALFSPNAAAPAWDYRVVYDVWVSTDAFGDAGFGSAEVEALHSLPTKIPGAPDVTPGPCLDGEGD
ncbi:MAG TPA: hypothetical protein VMG12_42395, partial [Polyangiaceae bacterium]|nr:hypothetical protein [Polyangiaceae bacterium]